MWLCREECEQKQRAADVGIWVAGLGRKKTTLSSFLASLCQPCRAADSQACVLAGPPQALALVPIAFLTFRRDNLCCPWGVPVSV